MGVAHPSGYPTYTLLGKFATTMYSKNPARALNILSSFFASLSLTVLFFVARKIYQNNLFAALPSAFLAFSSIFWSQAVITEVYSMNALFTALILLFAITWLDSRKPKHMLLLFFSLGLSFSHHLLAFFLLPGIALLFFVNRSSLLRTPKRFVLVCGIVFLAGLLPYCYLPLSASQSPVFNWGDPQTIHSFFRHITGTGEQMSVFSASAGTRNVFVFFSSLFFQFTPLGFFFILVGLRVLWLRQRAVANYLFLSGAAYLFVFFYWNIYDLHPYFTPSMLVFSLFIPAGIRVSASAFSILLHGKNNMTYLFAVLFFSVLAPTLLLFSNFSVIDKSADYTAIDRATNIIDSVPPGSVVIAEEIDAQPLSYLQQVLGSRKDVLVISRDALGKEWYHTQLNSRTGFFLPKTSQILVYFSDTFHMSRVRASCGSPGSPPTVECWNISRQLLSAWVVLTLYPDRRVFFTFEDKGYLPPGFAFFPAGILYEAAPEEAEHEMILYNYSFRGLFDYSAHHDPYIAFMIRAYSRALDYSEKWFLDENRDVPYELLQINMRFRELRPV